MMRIQVVGRGRMGTALHAALSAAGAGVLPLAGRGADGAGADLVLLAVPDSAIPEAARCIAPGPLVGHLSGMTGLDALAPHDALSLHPLLSVTGAGTKFTGAYAALAGGTDRATQAARDLADVLGLRTFAVADQDRAAYHAAASLAANALVALEWSAERLAATAGVPRAALAPLARVALENWAEHGAAAALTGPIARGDEETVARQRAAIAERLPADLALFDALAATTRALAAERNAGAAGVVLDAGAAAADPAPCVDPAPLVDPAPCVDPTPTAEDPS